MKFIFSLFPLLCFVLHLPGLWAGERALRVAPVSEGQRPGSGSAGLFVGVNVFRDESLSPLRYAVNDAVMQADLFVNQLRLLPASGVELALSGTPEGAEAVAALSRLRAAGVKVVEAERGMLFDALERLSKGRRGAGDLVVVGVSSHGFEEQEAFVAATDTRLTNLRRTGLDLGAFQEALSKSGAGKRLLLLDACRNQPRRDDRSLGAAAMAGFLKAVEAFQGEAVLTSCRKDEMSYESPDLKHGVFTHFLLEGLRGAAPTGEGGYITLGTLSEYVAEETTRWARERHGAKQTPSFKDADMRAKSMPLAIPLEQLEWRGRVDTLKRELAPKIGGEVTWEHFKQIMEHLELHPSTEEDSRTLMEAGESYAGGKISARMFRGVVEQLARGAEPLGSLEVEGGEIASRVSVNGGPPRTLAPGGKEQWDRLPVGRAELRIEWEGGEYSERSIIVDKTTTRVKSPARLQPVLNVRAMVAGREVPATLEMGGQRHTLPARLTLRENERYAGTVTLEESGKRYEPASLEVTADWRGVRERTVTLREIKGPVAEQAWTVPELGMKLLWVAPGAFRMGSASGGENDERPVREVRITRGYWMGKFEVTQGEWARVMGTTVREQRDKANREWPLFGEGDKHPMYYVSWEEAVEYCQKLTESERRAGRLPAGYMYRLPTEAEWEYAARGGSRGRGTTYAGSDNLGEVAWHSGNSGNQTRPVGGKAANELGLHDMSGNVWEWCHDWYQNSYTGLGIVDPVGPATGSYRVIRGGSWCDVASGCRVANRHYWYPSYANGNLGFRVVLAPQFQ